MTTLTSPVTVDRSHFEALVRRANFNMDSPASKSLPLPNANTIVVSRNEYSNLKLAAQQYANLRRNLLVGGVGEDTIDFLSKCPESASNGQSDLSSEPPQNPQIDGRWQTLSTDYAPPTQWDADRVGHLTSRYTYKQSSRFRRPSTGATSATGNDYSHAYTGRRSQDGPDWNDAFTLGEDNDMDDDGYASNDHSQAESDNTKLAGPLLEHTCNRSVQLYGITESTTHADITAAVRGGQLLDVYIRTSDRSAMVSFVRETDARAFFDHVRRHDLYIKNKRVDIRWSDRQFVLPTHVANKISVGATRNLVLRKCDSRVTEATVREDLTHIHNLIVIKVQFVDGDCHIYTNSVHNALFARTCMMSRVTYRGCKIGWLPDECAQPIQHAVPAAKPKKQTSTRKPLANVTNRFQLLNMDGGDGEDNDDEDNDDDGSECSTDNTSEGTNVFAFHRTKENVGIAA